MTTFSQCGASGGAIGDEALRQAAHWMAKLASGEATQSELAACAAWRAADSENEQAWQRAERLLGKLRCLPAPLAMHALDRPRSSARRDALRGLLGLAIAVPVGAYVWRRVSIDYRTATGERLTATLADGSRLLLDTATEVRIEFDAGMRRLRLLSGRVRVLTATDPASPARPFAVSVRHGNVLAARDACFSVETGDVDACVAVESGRVEIRTAADARTRVLPAGQQARFGATGIQTPRALEDADLGWIQGLLYADNERLDIFLVRLSRYRPGWTRCDPAAAGLRISGVFRLDDPERVLGVVSRTLPVRIVRFGPWIRIEAVPG